MDFSRPFCAQKSKHILLRCCNEDELPQNRCDEIWDHCPSDSDNQRWCFGDPGYEGRKARNQNRKHKTKVPEGMIEQKGRVSIRCLWQVQCFECRYGLNPLAAQVCGPQFETDDDSQHFERSDGQRSCVDERWIRGVKKAANTGNAGVGAETNRRIDPWEGS